MHESNTYLEDIQIKNTLFRYTSCRYTFQTHTGKPADILAYGIKQQLMRRSKLNLVKEGLRVLRRSVHCNFAIKQ